MLIWLGAHSAERYGFPRIGMTARIAAEDLSKRDFVPLIPSDFSKSTGLPAEYATLGASPAM